MDHGDHPPGSSPAAAPCDENPEFDPYCFGSRPAEHSRCGGAGKGNLCRKRHGPRAVRREWHFRTGSHTHRHVSEATAHPRVVHDHEPHIRALVPSFRRTPGDVIAHVHASVPCNHGGHSSHRRGHRWLPCPRLRIHALQEIGPLSALRRVSACATRPRPRASAAFTTQTDSETVRNRQCIFGPPPRPHRAFILATTIRTR